MSLFPLLHGIAATVLAALVMSIWIAIGALAPFRLSEDDEAALPVALLAGSGATAFALALFSLAGMVKGGVIATGIAGFICLVLRRAAVRRMIGGAFAEFRRAIRSRLTLMVMCAAAVVAWIPAIAPPRSADAMRYHLAHIRLIVMEGRWNPIQDFHFALPFGWTLSFLPFEMLGLPQGAQLLSLCILIVIAVSITRVIAKIGGGEVATVLVFLLMLHPFVARMFTEAGADPYSLLVVLAASLLLIRLPGFSAREAVAFGFVCWIGIGSRYQLFAIGLAAFAVLVVLVRRAPYPGKVLLAGGTGAVIAFILASPFLVMNQRWFGNAVWPLLMSPREGNSSYANLVAWFYGRSLTGDHDAATLISGAWNLLTWPRLFPLPILIIALIVAAAIVRGRARPLGWFGLLFLGLWAVMQPSLYPKFVLMLLPAAALCAVLLRRAQTTEKRGLLRLSQVALVSMVTINVALSRDAFAYSVDGNLEKYHGTTWFYPVYGWVNSHLAKDSKVLAIVRSGMTYYLERPYRRGDPWIGGEVDWIAQKDGQRFYQLLKQRGYTHVIYDGQDWSSFAGGPEMERVIEEAENLRLLIPLERFDVRLYASRLTGAYRPTRISVYEVAGGRIALGPRSAAMASATTP